MATASTISAPSATGRSGGRALFWGGIGCFGLGIVLLLVQVLVLKHLFVPWYMPVLWTVGALMLLMSVARRSSVVRIVALGLVAVLAALEWVFLVSVSRLPAYEGPARVGQPIPAFRTTLADGRTFTDEDLRQGTPGVLVFFRGRW